MKVWSSAMPIETCLAVDLFFGPEGAICRSVVFAGIDRVCFPAGRLESLILVIGLYWCFWVGLEIFE